MWVLLKQCWYFYLFLCLVSMFYHQFKSQTKLLGSCLNLCSGHSGAIGILTSLSSEKSLWETSDCSQVDRPLCTPSGLLSSEDLPSPGDSLYSFPLGGGTASSIPCFLFSWGKYFDMLYHWKCLLYSSLNDNLASHGILDWKQYSFRISKEGIAQLPEKNVNSEKS